MGHLPDLCHRREGLESPGEELPHLPPDPPHLGVTTGTLRQCLSWVFSRNWGGRNGSKRLCPFAKVDVEGSNPFSRSDRFSAFSRGKQGLADDRAPPKENGRSMNVTTLSVAADGATVARQTVSAERTLFAAPAAIRSEELR
jgi:hypothetical protein